MAISWSQSPPHSIPTSTQAAGQHVGISACLQLSPSAYPWCQSTLYRLAFGLTNTVWNEGRWWPRQELGLFMFICLTPLPITAGQGEAVARSAIGTVRSPLCRRSWWRRSLTALCKPSHQLLHLGACVVVLSVALTLRAISCRTG